MNDSALSSEKPMKIVPRTQEGNYVVYSNGARAKIVNISNKERKNVVFDKNTPANEVQKLVAEHFGLNIGNVPVNKTTGEIDLVGLDEVIENNSLTENQQNLSYKELIFIKEGAVINYYSDQGDVIGNINADEGKLFYTGKVRQLISGNFAEFFWKEKGVMKTGWIKQGEIDTAHAKLDIQSSNETGGVIIGGLVGSTVGVAIAGSAYLATSALGITTIVSGIVATPLILVVGTGALVGAGVGWIGARRGWW